MFKKWAKFASAALLALSVSITGLGVQSAEAAANTATNQEAIYQSNFWMAMLYRTYNQQIAASTSTATVTSTETVEELSIAKPQPAQPTVAGREYSKMLNVTASSYGPGNINWKYGGRTYSGTMVREGVISVDPKIIPLGTKVYVTGYSTPLLPAGGFVATAEDTGKAIKGNRIDIYMDGTQAQLRQFGMQNIKLYVLK